MFCVVFCRPLFVFSGVRIAHSSVFCAVFCRPLFVFSGVRIAHSSVFCAVFCRPLFVFSGFVLLILQCSVWCFVDHCLFLVGSYCSFFSVLCSVL